MSQAMPFAGMASGTRDNLATILALNGTSERDVELVALGLNAAPAILEGRVDAMAATDSILYGTSPRS